MVSLSDQEITLKLIIVMLKYDYSGQLIFIVKSIENRSFGQYLHFREFSILACVFIYNICCGFEFTQVLIFPDASGLVFQSPLVLSLHDRISL